MTARQLDLTGREVSALPVPAGPPSDPEPEPIQLALDMDVAVALKLPQGLGVAHQPPLTGEK